MKLFTTIVILITGCIAVYLMFPAGDWQNLTPSGHGVLAVDIFILFAAGLKRLFIVENSDQD